MINRIKELSRLDIAGLIIMSPIILALCVLILPGFLLYQALTAFFYILTGE